jgi:hypothetical protein
VPAAPDPIIQLVEIHQLAESKEHLGIAMTRVGESRDQEIDRRLDFAVAV